MYVVKVVALGGSWRLLLLSWEPRQELSTIDLTVNCPNTKCHTHVGIVQPWWYPQCKGFQYPLIAIYWASHILCPLYFYPPKFLYLTNNVFSLVYTQKNWSTNVRSLDTCTYLAVCIKLHLLRNQISYLLLSLLPVTRRTGVAHVIPTKNLIHHIHHIITFAPSSYLL
jgi:hypothetical protein